VATARWALSLLIARSTTLRCLEPVGELIMGR
jgi:hypothetical protein